MELGIILLLLIVLPEKPIMESSLSRVETIKGLLNKEDLGSNSHKWELVRREIQYLDFQIKNNGKFKLTQYLQKNNFMQELIGKQLLVDKMIDNLLNA